MKQTALLFIMMVSCHQALATQESLSGERERAKDKTDVYAIPLDTSPVEERANREMLKELQEDVQEKDKDKSAI